MSASRKPYYECHITMEHPIEDREKVKRAVETLGRRFSSIEGDILLGGGVKFYATRHYNHRKGYGAVLQALMLAAAALASQGANPTRRKVESVLFDDRSTKTGKCVGGCIACHLDDLVGGTRDSIS